MKNFIKKFSAIVLIAVMVCTLFSTIAFAENTKPAFEVQNVNVAPGQYGNVTVSIKNNPGIASIKLILTFDKCLTLNSVTYNTAIGGQTVLPETYKSPVTLIWISPFQNYSGDDVFATLNFTVSETATTNYTAPINIKYDPDDVYNMDEDNVGFAIINGSVFIPADVCTHTNKTYVPAEELLVCQ